MNGYLIVVAIIGIFIMALTGELQSIFPFTSDQTSQVIDKNTSLCPSAYNSPDPLNIPSKCYTGIQPQPYFQRDSMHNTYDSAHSSSSITISAPDGKQLYTFITTPTGSMRPALSDGSTQIVVYDLNEDEVRIGDIVSYRCNILTGYLTHRVNAIYHISGQTSYVMKGDNNPADDLSTFGCSAKLSDIKYKVVGVLY